MGDLRDWETGMDEMIGQGSGPDEPEKGRVVVTGFEPFDGRTRNRSWDLVSKLRGEQGRDVFRLPVDLGQLYGIVAGILSREPRAILMIGESPTNQLRVEQVALNVADSEDPDNAGRIPQAEPVVPRGPLALMTSWDARGVAGRLHQEGIPAAVSFHAGTFACNAALYLALFAAREAQRQGDSVTIGSDPGGIDEGRITPPAIGFFHIPNSRGPTGLGTANLCRAVELGIEELLAENQG